MGAGAEFLWIVITILIVWGLFAIGTMGSQSTKKRPGDQLSERGVTLTQSLFWIIIIFVFVLAFAAMVNGS